MFEKAVVKKIREFIDRATSLGLPQPDRENAVEFLSYNEWGLAFDLVAAQLFDHGIEIDSEFLRLAREIQKEMHLDEREYAYLDELLKKGSYLGD
ncbi:MAG: MafI family immunity protein [Acidobacteria bacterium]|nr:MafI family immunity protein [Acidobacteriota bacterium]